MSLHEVRVADVVDQGHRQRAIRLEPVGAQLHAAGVVWGVSRVSVTSEG